MWMKLKNWISFCSNINLFYLSQEANTTKFKTEFNDPLSLPPALDFGLEYFVVQKVNKNFFCEQRTGISKL